MNMKEEEEEEEEEVLLMDMIYLEDGKVLQHGIHHVLLGQVFEFVYKVDHVLAHGRAVDAVHEAAVLETRVLRLHLLHHLLPERAHLRAARDRHVLVTLVPANHQKSSSEIIIRNHHQRETPVQLTAGRSYIRRISQPLPSTGGDGNYEEMHGGKDETGGVGGVGGGGERRPACWDQMRDLMPSTLMT